MELKMIKLDDIVTNPLQPRQEFDREKLQELANSINEGELLQPIVVRLKEGKFEIVAGERRYKAFQILKEPKIPAIIREIKDDTDALEKSLIENWQRDDLTSAEKEKALTDLWKSKRYKDEKELAKKLGLAKDTIQAILRACTVREKLNVSDKIATRTILDTAGLNDEPKKKFLKQVEEGKISTDKVRDVVRKVKEFPEPEQQLEILEEFEQQEDTSREMFDDIIQKKKEISQGKRPPDHYVEIESDSDKRKLENYYDIKSNIYDIVAIHIQKLKTQEAQDEATQILWDIYKYTERELIKLGKIQGVVDA